MDILKENDTGLFGGATRSEDLWKESARTLALEAISICRLRKKIVIKIENNIKARCRVKVST